jgi:N4-gp56 family major capsid protein
MALTNFIPAVWSASLLTNLQKSLVFGNLANRDYEGEVAGAGSTVNINAIGAVTVGAYTKDTNHSAPETLTSTQSVLSIDQQKFFNLQIDDVDKAQTVPKVMEAAMAEAGYALANDVDTYISGLHASASSSNLVGSTGTPTALTSANAYETLVSMAKLLSISNATKQGRWVALPPQWVALLLADSRFVASGAAEGDARLQNGLVGRTAGFDIYETNNTTVVSSTKYKVLAGTPQAITLASQVDSVVAYRPELRFADAVKGLLVYGSKVVRPECLACATVTF